MFASCLGIEPVRRLLKTSVEHSSAEHGIISAPDRKKETQKHLSRPLILTNPLQIRAPGKRVWDCSV